MRHVNMQPMARGLSRLSVVAIALACWVVPAASSEAHGASLDSEVQIEPAQRPGAPPRPATPVQASQHDVTLATWDLGGSAAPDHPSNKPNFHPAVRVLVSTRLLSSERRSGNLGSRAILAQTRSAGYWPFRLCFEEELRVRPRADGVAVLRFSVGSVGKVTYARRLPSALSGAAMQCLRRAVYALRFKASLPRRVDAELSVRFSGGDVDLAPRNEVAPRMLPDADVVAATVAPEVRLCYASARQQDRGLWGRLLFTLQMGLNGEVRQVAVTPSMWAPQALSTCIERALETLRFPGHEGAIQLVFRLGSLPGEGAR